MTLIAKATASGSVSRTSCTITVRRTPLGESDPDARQDDRDRDQDDSNGDLKAEEREETSTGNDDHGHAGKRQEVAKHFQRRQRDDPKTDPDRNREHRLSADQHDAHSADRRAGDHDALVAGHDRESDRSEHSETRPDHSKEEQVVEDLGALDGRSRHRDLPAAHGGQAGVGDAGDDAEYRHHGRVPPEVVYPEVPKEENCRREAECGADPEADPADEPSPDDPPSRLGRPEEIERHLIGVGDHVPRCGYPGACAT